MSNYLLDSDILMDFFKKKRDAVELISALIKKGNLSTSILSVVELRSGWNPKQAKIFLSRLYDTIEIKNITIQIAELAGEFRWEYRMKGISLPTIDTLIASTAIVENLQLVTRNKKDYPMPELKLYTF